jgi:hypothetical protein
LEGAKSKIHEDYKKKLDPQKCLCTTKVPNVQKGVKVEDNVPTTNPNNDFWETPIELKMMNDMVENHETFSLQKAFEKKQ